MFPGPPRPHPKSSSGKIFAESNSAHQLIKETEIFRPRYSLYPSSMYHFPRESRCPFGALTVPVPPSAARNVG
jgi:hypothetical protein